jgi:hypothetical protein
VSAPRSPLRWHKVSKPYNWSQLCRTGKVLATVYPDGRWESLTLGGEGKAPNIADAKFEAIAFVRKALAEAKTGEP